MVNEAGSGVSIAGVGRGAETLDSDFESLNPMVDGMLVDEKSGEDGNVSENRGREEKSKDKMNSMEFERGEDDEFDLSKEHSKALVEYVDGGFRETGKYVERLIEILRIKSGDNGAEVRANHESEGVGENERDVGNNDLPVLRAPLPPSAVNPMSVVASFQEANIAEVAMILFNLSAALFQMERLREAREVLEHLFLHIEPLDDHIAVAVSCLLLDVLCISTRGRILGRAKKRRHNRQTDAILAFLERPHSLNPSLPCLSNSVSEGHEEGGGSTTYHHGAARDREQTEFIFRLHLYKAKVLLLQHESKQCKKEVKGALEIFQRELRELEQQSDEENQHQSIEDCGRWKAFGRLPHPGVQNMAALYAKANLEYQRDNPKKALKLLASCHGIQGSDEYVGPGEPMGPLYYNNMGCLHHKLGKHHVALHYFQKALQEQGNSPGMEDSGNQKQDGHLSGTISYEILYNTGLQLQRAGRPAAALRCFDRASLQFCDRPLLWLRMAECCLSIHSSDGGGSSVKESGRERLQDVEGGRRTLHGRLVGKGLRRRALLHPVGPAGEDQSPESLEILLQAERYLQNALYLCCSSSSLFSDALQDGNANNGPIGYPEFSAAKDGQRTPEYTSYGVSDVSPQQDTDLKLLQRVYLNLSYVYLGLGNPVSALNHAQKSLSLELHENNSSNDRILALSRSYAAEAHVMMDRPQEALNELSSIQDGHNGGRIMTKGGEVDISLTVAVLLNKAATLAYLGKISEAQHLMQAAMHCSGGYSSSKANHMLVYILLKSKRPIEAVRALNLL